MTYFRSKEETIELPLLKTTTSSCLSKLIFVFDRYLFSRASGAVHLIDPDNGETAQSDDDYEDAREDEFSDVEPDMFADPADRYYRYGSSRLVLARVIFSPIEPFEPLEACETLDLITFKRP